MRWIHEVGSSLTQVFYLYNEPDTLTNKSIVGFTTTASRVSPNYTLTSTATLTRAMFSDNNITLQCQMFIINPPLPRTIVTEGIINFDRYNVICNSVLGATNPPSDLVIMTLPASLTWLPPPNTNCAFNYTVNITNSSCSMTVYSSSTSLILTDLLTCGQNYSFAVAVTDSTGQHGPWSDQLMVTWDGTVL